MLTWRTLPEIDKMNTAVSPSKDTPFACGICGEMFLSRNKLFRHLKDTDEVHTRQTNEVGQDGPEQKKPRKVSPSDIDEGICTVCEDNDWYRVIVKPQGLATMGTRGHTLMRSDKLLLPGAFKLQLAYKKAVPCHRLDRATGGVMLCSKSKLAERILMTCFKYKLIHKKYLAVVVGRLEPAEGTIETPISGKPALTRYSVTRYTPSKQYGWISTVELWPVTGKKHQLRRHLQSIGHSIINDKRFSLPQLWSHIVRSNIDAMFLWAVEIDFIHPQYCTKLVSNVEDSAITEANGTNSAPIDQDSDEDDASDEEEEDLEAKDESGAAEGNCRRAEMVAELRALPSATHVVASIPEPLFYAEYRAIHEKSVVV